MVLVGVVDGTSSSNDGWGVVLLTATTAHAWFFLSVEDQ